MLVHGESGVLVPAEDARALAAALVRLLADRDERARLGNAAYARLTTRFSLDGFAARMFAAFDEAVADGIR
jgi:glycosyltransferase involved in cell wall biosynthesis